MKDTQPSGVLSLDANATMDVSHDMALMTLATEQDGADAEAISAALAKRADAVMKQAKSVAGIEARTGSFTVYPMNDNKGRITTWRGRAEVLLESRDFASLSKLSGQVASNMQVAGVQFSLSREAQKKAEEKLIEQAIQTFKDKAQTASRAFGYGGFTIREVNVGQNSNQPMPRAYAMRSAAVMSDAAPVPVEGGKAQVTVSVSGSIQMTR